MNGTEMLRKGIASGIMLMVGVVLASVLAIGFAPAQDAYAAPVTTAPKVGSTFTVDGNTYKITDRYKSARDLGEVVLVKYGSNKTTVTIDTVSYKGGKYEVETIGKNAFNNAKGKKVVSVTLGKNVEEIQSRAFYGCSKLATLNIAKSDVIEVDYSRKTKSYYLDDVEIGSQAFTNAGVKNITVKCGSSNAQYQKVVKNALVKKGMRNTVKVVR